MKVQHSIIIKLHVMAIISAIIAYLIGHQTEIHWPVDSFSGRIFDVFAVVYSIACVIIFESFALYYRQKCKHTLNFSSRR